MSSGELLGKMIIVFCFNLIFGHLGGILLLHEILHLVFDGCNSLYKMGMCVVEPGVDGVGIKISLVLLHKNDETISEMLSVAKIDAKSVGSILNLANHLNSENFDNFIKRFKKAEKDIELQENSIFSKTKVLGHVDVEGLGEKEESEINGKQVESHMLAAVHVVPVTKLMCYDSRNFHSTLLIVVVEIFLV